MGSIFIWIESNSKLIISTSNYVKYIMLFLLDNVPDKYGIN